MNQNIPQEGELFFQRMNEQINEFQERLQNWQQQNHQKFDFAEALIEKERTELQSLRKYVSEVKIYITFMGTLSTGKSTFINSLLGQQLLPSRAQECTKQFLFITYGEKIKINDIEYETLKEAEQVLLKMQSDQHFNRVDIQTNSLFHIDLPRDLRNRIIFVDTPGVKTGQDELENPQQRLNEILDHQDMCINIWVSDYQHFDNDKQKIFYLLQVMSKDFFQQNEIPVDQNQLNNNEYLDKLFFVLNKIDTRKKSEDKNIEEVIKEICQKVGDDHFIYKISSINALYYKIMNFGDKMAQDKFIQSYFIDNDDTQGFGNINQCKEYCVKNIKDNKLLMQNQQYSSFYGQLKEKIVQKITIGFNCNSLQQVISYDSFLKIIFSNDNQLILESNEDKELIKILMARQLNLILQYKQNLQQYFNQCLNQLNELIQTNQDELEYIQINKVMRNVCDKTVNFQSEIKQDIQKINKKYKQDILQQINELQFESEIKRNLQEECRNMFNRFSDAQAINLFHQTHEEMEKDICQKLGIRLIRISTSQKIALAGIGLFQIRRAIVAALNNYVGEYIQAWICMCGTFFLATLDESFTLEYVSKEIAKQKLAEFKEARKNQINTLCFDLIRINEQTLKGLQFLFNQLIGV